MRAKVILFVVAILPTFYQFSWAFTIPPPNISDNSKNLSPNQQSSKTTEEMINQQSENIRHIIAAEQKTFEQREKQDSGRQVKKEKAIITIEDDGFASLEELRAKCQHFARLFGLNPPSSENYGSGEIVDTRQSTTTITPLRAEFYNSRPPVEVARRPVFIRNKPTFIEKGSGGFYVTATPIVNDFSTTKKPYWLSTTTYPRVAYNPEPSSSTSTTTTTKQTTTTTEKIVENLETTTAKPKIKIKFTKFEPVILQKTILSDGRVMYHWHRSLPTAPVDLLAPIVSPIVPTPALSDYPPSAQRNLDSRLPIDSQSSSTTTTEKSSWLFVPFSNLFGGSHQEETTTIETITTPPTTTSTVSTTTNKVEVSSTPSLRAVSPQQNDDQKAQLKLVVPVHYGDVDAAISSQNDNKLDGTPRKAPPLQVVKTVQIPQHIPRYSLGYTGAGYGFPAYNGFPYGAESYGPDYMNYQAYGHAPLDREDKKLDDVTV